MKTTARTLLLGAAALVLGIIVTPILNAQTSEAVTSFSVTEKVTVGSAILDPGVYVLRVVPLMATRNVIQVTSPQTGRVHATLMATPHEIARGEMTAENRLVFSNGTLRTWLVANSAFGYDLLERPDSPARVATVQAGPAAVAMASR